MFVDLEPNLSSSPLLKSKMKLEDEILANSWLSAPATAEIVFDMPFDQRWSAAAKTLGVDITQISPDAGHA